METRILPGSLIHARSKPQSASTLAGFVSGSPEVHFGALNKPLDGRKPQHMKQAETEPSASGKAFTKPGS